MFEPVTAKADTDKPVTFVPAQLVPLSVETKTPAPPAPAKIFELLAARDKMSLDGSPDFAAVQVVPLFVETYTPPLTVPAKMFEPLTASE